MPPPVLVDTPSAFAALLDKLEHEPIIALDTESDSLYRYYYKVCLIQLTIPARDYIIDPLRLPDLTPLGQLLADPAVEKVFHAAENDVLVLKRDFSFQFAHIFDTMLAARILGRRRVSLAALLSEHFGVQLDKRSQLTDWGHRPLTAAQLSYAHLDSHFLLALRDLLKQELQDHGRWQEAQEAFSALPEITYVEKEFDPEGFWRSKGARELSGPELAVLSELYLWRDAKARQLDLPPFKVLHDRDLVQLSKIQPGHFNDLPLSKWQARRFGREVLRAVAQGQAAPPPQVPVRQQNGDRRPDPAAQARFEALRAWRARRAEQRGVDTDVVLTNDVLMTIARAAPRSLADLADLKVIGPWKLQEYGEDLLATIA